MYFKEYGNTGIKVSAIGFGAMRFDKEDIKEGRLGKCADLVLYAWDKGINYWDTAPNYCEDKSEAIVGMAVKQVRREEVYLSTKTNFWAMGEKDDRDSFRKRLETSLERLQTDYIDFYHLWCLLNMESYEKHMEKLYGFFEEAHSEGLIRNIVFSSHMEGNAIEKIIETGKFKGMLIGYNPLNHRFRQSGLGSAYERGMGVVAMNPVGGGIIPNHPEMFSYLTEGTDLNVAQAALRFVASHQEIAVTLNGFTVKEQVDEAVKAVENLEEKPAAEVIAGISEGVSMNNLCTGCGYCRVCPVDVLVPEYMDAYNMKLITGEAKNCLRRLHMQWGIEKEDAGKCIACKKCEEACTQHLPIIERLDEIAKMVGDAS